MEALIMTPPPLSLRQPRPSDAAALEAVVSDPEVALPTAACRKNQVRSKEAEGSGLLWDMAS